MSLVVNNKALKLLNQVFFLNEEEVTNSKMPINDSNLLEHPMEDELIIDDKGFSTSKDKNNTEIDSIYYLFEEEFIISSVIVFLNRNNIEFEEIYITPSKSFQVFTFDNNDFIITPKRHLIVVIKKSIVTSDLFNFLDNYGFRLSVDSFVDLTSSNGK